MNKRNILFVYPPLNEETKRGIESNPLYGADRNLEISFLYLDAYLRKKIPGIECRYLDFRIENRDDAEKLLHEQFSSGTIKYVGFTCYSCHYLSVITIARLIKKIDPNIVIIVGGFHPTIKPFDFSFDRSPIDYIIRGEGEISLSEIVQNNLGPVLRPRILESPNLLTLDEVPPLKLDLMERYRGKLDFSELSIYISRGCTFNCSFCISREETCGLKQYRFMSLKNIQDQLEILESYAPARIVIQDPLFGVNKTWFEDVTGLLWKKDRSYKVKVEMHVDLLNEDKLARLMEKKIDLAVGFESASRQMLYLMNKTKDPAKYVNNAKNLVERFSESGQELILNILIGHPGESKSTLDESFAFLSGLSERMNGVLPKFSLFRLYPGTPVYLEEAFFKKVFHARYYLKEWWYYDVDHALVPCIVDPSKDLDLISEISYTRDRINDFIDNVTKSSDSLSIAYKLAFLKNLSKINRSFDMLKDKMFLLKQQLPALANSSLTNAGVMKS